MKYKTEYKVYKNKILLGSSEYKLNMKTKHIEFMTAPCSADKIEIYADVVKCLDLKLKFKYILKII